MYLQHQAPSQDRAGPRPDRARTAGRATPRSEPVGTTPSNRARAADQAEAGPAQPGRHHRLAPFPIALDHSIRRSDRTAVATSPPRSSRLHPNSSLSPAHEPRTQRRSQRQRKLFRFNMTSIPGPHRFAPAGASRCNTARSRRTRNARSNQVLRRKSVCVDPPTWARTTVDGINTPVPRNSHDGSEHPRRSNKHAVQWRDLNPAQPDDPPRSSAIRRRTVAQEWTLPLAKPCRVG